MAGTGRIIPQNWIRSARRTPPPRHRASQAWMPTGAAGSWQAAGGVFSKWQRPDPVPMQAYTKTVRAPIGNNGRLPGIIQGGAATIAIGPQGIGTRWYPKSVTIATQNGAADAGTAAGFFDTVLGQPIFQSYACGGDTQGLAVPDMQPGDLLFVVFSNSSVPNGGWCSIVVIGDMDALTF
jgi:hypothetical protein